MIEIDQSLSNKCVCKGIRKCAICSPNIAQNSKILSDKKTFIYCQRCQNSTLITGKSLENVTNFLLNSVETQNKECYCLNDTSHSQKIQINGIFIKQNFINYQEEQFLINEMDDFTWNESQSGRFKQDFGPKANFNRKKLKYNTFSGLPFYSKFLVERINQNVNKTFRPVELCNLKYDRTRAACIDPHYDDTWLWGDRLITVNLLENTYLTLLPGLEINDKFKNIEILIPMPRYSLLILSNDARYKWMHSIKNNHINSIRIAMTFRELSDYFVNDEIYENLGKKIEDLAVTFKGCAVGVTEKILSNPVEKFEKENLFNLDKDFNNVLLDELNFDINQTKINVIDTNQKSLTMLIENITDKYMISISKTSPILKTLIENIHYFKDVFATDNIVKIFNVDHNHQDFLVLCENYSNSKKSVNLNQENLFKIGRLIGKSQKISNQIFPFKNIQINLNENELFIDNINFIEIRFDEYKKIYFNKINSLKIDVSIKTKAVAILYNLKRIIHYLNNDIDKNEKGIVVGGFNYSKIISNQEEIRSSSILNNVECSYFLSDLALTQCDFILNAFENDLSYRDIAITILKGYESEIKQLDLIQKDFLHNLILFYMILGLFKNEVKNEHLLIFEEIYLDSNFLN